MASWFTPAEQNGDELALRLGSPVLLPLAQALDFTFGLPSYGALSTAAGCAPAAGLTGLDAFWSHASLEDLECLSTGLVPSLPENSTYSGVTQEEEEEQAGVFTPTKGVITPSRKSLGKRQCQAVGAGYVRLNKTVTVEQVRAVQHMNQVEAAKALGMGTTQLKMQCRKLGIARWPYRKLMSCRSLAASCEHAARKTANSEVSAKLKGMASELRAAEAKGVITQLPPFADRIKCLQRKPHSQRAESLSPDTPMRDGPASRKGAVSTA